MDQRYREFLDVKASNLAATGFILVLCTENEKQVEGLCFLGDDDQR